MLSVLFEVKCVFFWILKCYSEKTIAIHRLVSLKSVNIVALLWSRQNVVLFDWASWLARQQVRKLSDFNKNIIVCVLKLN